MMHNLKIILRIFDEHQFVTTTEADVVISSIQFKIAGLSLITGSLCCVPEQDTLAAIKTLSTGLTQKDLYRHN